MVSGVTASCNMKQVAFFFLSISFLLPGKIIDHFTGMDLSPMASSAFEADCNLVLMQTSFALLWKLSLKNTG